MDWSKLFDNYGLKAVTKTDKDKAAYVPNAEQRTAIEAAGISPAATRPGPPFPIVVLFDHKVTSVTASYYYAVRATDPTRKPEPRMGQEIISSWLNIGDVVVIGNIGPQMFACKVSAAPASEEDGLAEVAKRADKTTVIKRAKMAKGKPAKRTVQRDDFVRNPFVVRGAIVRSGGKCEMPGCKSALFEREDGSPYLEVHHVVPLSEEGDDTLLNAAALCPHCHRELHFGKARLARRTTLATYIAKATI
ncbi:HNH endonuclease signature motif containing protein [Cupriavidus pauculus]|uniref:HNH endonuclease n=1 Tax=Cupriavidus pauculus TaxID=82633 RepID=UPI001EE300AB|nr:HNH endonuclease signature motif containing protein [Cupriavidus pauculus]GJG98730.1 hypothetical protein CBA19C6_29595 [Cupriavidus pauculus]